MAKKKNSKQPTATGKTVPEGVHCQDCDYSYDYHEKDIKGEFFLCKCPFFEFSKFLRLDICNKFKLKKR